MWPDFPAFLGTLPAELTQMTLLTDLQLWDNQLVGSIPDEISELTNLTALGLSENLFTGTIATSLGRLTRLNEFSLFSNSLEVHGSSIFSGYQLWSKLTLFSFSS